MVQTTVDQLQIKGIRYPYGRISNAKLVVRRSLGQWDSREAASGHVFVENPLPQQRHLRVSIAG